MIRSVLLVTLLYSASSSAVLAQTWTEHVIAGMYGPPSAPASSKTGGAEPFRLHDAVPAGMPSTWSWYTGAVPMRWNSPKPPTADVVETPILTGRFGDAEPDTHGKNYCTHIRNFELWYFSAEQKRWKVLDATDAWGAHYHKRNFRKAAPINAVKEADGSISFPARTESWTHYYTSSWPYRIVREPFLYLHARGQLKISGPDAPTARVLGSVGIDYKAIGPEGKSVNGYVVPAALSAAMKLLTTEYQWVTATTMTPDEIRAHPPPRPLGWLDSTPAAEPRSPSTDPLASPLDPAPPASLEATADASSTAHDH